MGAEHAHAPAKTTAPRMFLWDFDLCSEDRDGILSQIVIGDKIMNHI